MTDAEKELVGICKRVGSDKIDSYGLAKAIIARYPQVLAEKVWEGDVYAIEGLHRTGGKDLIKGVWINNNENINKKIKVYIEVQS